MKPIIDKYIILAKSVAVAFVVAFVACLTAVAQERTDTVSYRYIPLSQEEICRRRRLTALCLKNCCRHSRPTLSWRRRRFLVRSRQC